MKVVEESWRKTYEASKTQVEWVSEMKNTLDGFTKRFGIAEEKNLINMKT